MRDEGSARLRAAGSPAPQAVRQVMRERPAERNAPPAGAPRFYSVTQTSNMLGLSDMTLYRAIQCGEFPAVRIRGRYVIPARAIEEMIEAAIASNGLVDAADWAVQGGVA